MLIDDDSAHALVLEAQLAKTGLAEQVLIFHQAEQALQFLRNCQAFQLPDVLLVDINMPDMSGWDFLLNYEDLSHRKDISIYVLSSSTAQRDKDQAHSEPYVSDCLHKPVTVERLVGILALA